VIAVPAAAQSLTGVITGTVKDEQGGALPGVNVTLTGKTGSKTATTDTSGNYVIANVTAWFVANIGSYVMNSTITFAAESGRRLHLKGYLGFALSQIMGFFANTGTVWCLVELLFVPAWAAKVAAIAVSFVVNFSLSHFLVFRAQPRQNAD